jgi:general secretion pathway protein H
MRFSSKTGFTLVEILVVMVLLALAGSLVFVSTGKTVAGNRNRAFTREMISLCKTARRMAVDDGVPTAFNISSGQRRCWVGDGTKSIEIPEEMLIEGEGITQLNEDVYSIGFYPDGSSGGGALTLSVSGQTVYAFRIDMLTGMLNRIEEDA